MRRLVEQGKYFVLMDFMMDMSFSEEDIRDMLSEYEQDCETGMDTEAVAKMLYDETAGYPFLVCSLCKAMDEELPEKAAYGTMANAWTKERVLAAERTLLAERNQFIIEMKIRHGKEYNERGKKQLAEYLDTYKKKTGYMISFSFNKNKTVGVKEIMFGDKKISKLWCEMQLRYFFRKVYYLRS